jgi:hypothetical protein
MGARPMRECPSSALLTIEDLQQNAPGKGRFLPRKKSHAGAIGKGTSRTADSIQVGDVCTRDALGLEKTLRGAAVG